MKKRMKKYMVAWRSGGYGQGGGHSVVIGYDIRDALKRNGERDVEYTLKYGINWYEEVKK